MLGDSDLIFTSVWPTVLFVLSVVLVLIEYIFIKTRRAVFTVISSAFMAGSCVALVFSGCSLRDLLIMVCATAALRLFFEILEGKKAK